MFLIEGIILVILGIAAIVLPPIATIAFTIIIGWIFLVSGIVGLITTFMARQRAGLLVGADLRAYRHRCRYRAAAVADQRIGFADAGADRVFRGRGHRLDLYAIEHRNQLSGRWGWMLISGIIDLILAGIIFAGLPGTAVWALGLLVGINMVFGGMALIAMAMAARHPAAA